MLSQLRALAAALLLCVAGPSLAATAAPAPAPAPATEQNEIATLKAQVAALKDQRDLEKRLATLEGKTVAEDRSRDNLTKTITILGFIITFIGIATGFASYIIAGAKAAKEARDETEKELLKIRTEFDKIAVGKFSGIDTKLAELSSTAATAKTAADESVAELDRVSGALTRLMSRMDSQAARIVEQLNKLSALDKKAKPTDEQIEAIEAVTTESAATPESQWSVDQFKAAIGKAMYVDKNWTEAERLAAAMERVHHTNDDARLYAHNRRGDAARELHRYGDALAAYEAVIVITTKAPHEGHQRDYIWAAHHLALCMNHLGRNAEAEAMLNELLPLREKVDGPEVSETLATRHLLACAIIDQGRAAEAEAMLRPLLSICEKVDGPEVSGTLATRHVLASAILEQGRAAEAEAMLRALLPICERVDGPEVSGTLVTRHVLARAILNQGRAAEAEAMLRALLPICEKVDGPEVLDTLVTRYVWADALVQSGDAAGAKAALAPIADPVPNNDWLPRRDAALAFVRGRVADAFNDNAAADGHLHRADTIYASLYPADHPDRVRLAAYCATRPAGGAPDA